MIPLLRSNILVFMILSGLVCEEAAATPPATRSDVQKLIEDLGHDQYHRRQAAKAELIELAGRR